MERLTKRNEFGEACISGKDNCEVRHKTMAMVERLAELEDKLESGQLIEFPRITETVKGIEWAVEYLNTSNYGSGIAKIHCGTKTQAEAKLKQLRGETK